MTSELTKEELHALDAAGGLPARVVVAGQMYVLLPWEDFEWLRQTVPGVPDATRRADPRTQRTFARLLLSDYERIQALFEETPISPEERAQHLREFGIRAGWDDAKTRRGILSGPHPAAALQVTAQLGASTRATVMARRLYRWPIVLGVIALSVVAGLFYFGYTCHNPRDRVHVDFVNVPGDVYFCCAACETGGVPRTMKWYIGSIGGAFTMDPANCIASSPYDRRFGGPVEWQFGERYGVVTRSKDGKWRITWFDADTVPIKDRSVLTGGGKVVFDLSEGHTEPLTDDEVSALGLKPVEQLRNW
jgi:hypothetical protein